MAWSSPHSQREWKPVFHVLHTKRSQFTVWRHCSDWSLFFDCDSISTRASLFLFTSNRLKRKSPNCWRWRHSCKMKRRPHHRSSRSKHQRAHVTTVHSKWHCDKVSWIKLSMCFGSTAPKPSIRQCSNWRKCWPANTAKTRNWSTIWKIRAAKYCRCDTIWRCR